MTSSKLRTCTTCRQGWPHSDEHDLRSFGWLDPLPRNITISNGDCLIHDGYHGSDRFLLFEAKVPGEPALRLGQKRLLTALAGQPRWIVRLLIGRLASVIVLRVSSSGVATEGVRTTAEAVRASTVDWVNGLAWQEPRGIRDVSHQDTKGHTCGWAKVDDAWMCVQDYYAKGFAPETGCGSTWDGLA
jgi:hypothetical protein